MAVDLEEFKRLLDALLSDDEDFDDFGYGEISMPMLNIGVFIEGQGNDIVNELGKLRADFADAMKILKPMAAYCEARHGFGGPVNDDTGVLCDDKKGAAITVGHFRAAKIICDRQA